MAEEPEVIGGRRARGTRRKLTERNTEDVSASSIEINDLVMHPNFRNPITVNSKTINGGLVTFDATHDGDPVSWQILEDATVRRVLQSEEDE